MLQKYNIEMATLKEVYDAFKADGAPLPDTYEDFEKYMTSGPDNGYEHRKQWYDAFKADGAPLPDTYEDFSRALFKVEADEKPAQTARATQPSQSAEPAPKPATRYFKLRRGGEDFTVTTDEVNSAGGLGAWAKAHSGAPVRVYMQGKNEDGTDFNGHVDLSVAHDRNKRLGYKYSTYSHPIVNKPQKSWTPTTQQKIAMSHQLHQMQKQADDMLEQSRERTKNVSEYYRDNRDSGFHAVEGKPTYNSRTGKVEKTYLTPTGDRTTDKNLADMEAQEARAQYEFNNRMKAAGLDPSNDMDVNRQMIADRLKENEARLKELYAEREVERYGERAGDTGWDKFVRTFGGAVNRGVTANAPTPEQNLTERDKEIKDLLAENDMLSEAKRTLDAGRDLKRSGGFMGGFFDVKNNAKNITRGLTDVAESADTYLSGVMSLHNAERLDIIKDKVDKGVELTDSELNLVYAAMLNQDASSSVKLPHGYTAGKVTGEMLPFMIQMALNPASGLGRALTKKFGTTALKRIAASVAGDVAEAAVLSNSLQAPRTIADIRNRHRGEITEHDGKIGFVGGESLPMAIYKGEASSIIENYTELLGSHFGAIGKGIWRGVDKGARKLGAGKVMDNVSRMVNNIKASDWAKGIANIESRAQWNGTIGEVMEEEAGIVLNSIFTGDNKLSDLVDAEQQIDIVLGVGLFGGFVSGIKTAGYPIARAHANSNLRKKDSEGAQQFSSDKWAAIKEQIDTSEDEALAQTVLSMVKVNCHSQEQQRAIIEYAAALTKARGYNLADASRKQEPQTEADSAQDEVDTAFNEGYEAATPQQMADAQNMFEYQRKRAEDILADQQLLDILDSNPVGALMGMTQTGMYTQEEIDAARDYANAKTVRDGILQRVTDDIDERIAQSDAMINGRVNRETGSILSATMDLDDRQVYIVGGEVVMNPDGTIDYDASDESLVVRDAVTGELEFTAPKSIVKVGEAIDPEAEKANAADNIRQQAAQAAANALNGTLAFNPGDVVRINDGGGLTDVTIVGPVVDEESGMPVESQLTVQFPNGQQTAFTKEQLQAFADAANLERLNQYEQERAAQRAQQRGAAEFDTYNGAAIATAAPEDSEGGESSAEAAVQNHSSEAEAEQPETALGRIPLGENGKPDFGAVDAETAWDGLVEKYEGNKGRAQGFAANMVKIKEAALKKAEKVKSKPTEDPDEWDAAEQERENAIEQARLELEHWQSVAGVDEKRQAAVRAQQEAERAEAERAEREAAEAEKKRKAALDKRLHDTYEDVKDVPEAVEVLEDMDPRDIYEAAAQLLSGQKVLWGDAGVKVGARSETGFGEEERRRLFGLFASEANGGKSLSRLAEDAMKQQCETYGIPYDNQDARNALIDVISGARTVGDIRNYIANNRIDEARRLAEAKRRHEEEQYDEFCRQEYHLSAEVAEAYAQRLNAHGIEVPFNTVPPALRDALAERGVKIGKPEKGNAGSASLPAFQQWINEQERQRMGDGYGAYSDAEVSLANDPVSKVVGKNRFSKKRQAEFAARERQRMADRIQRLAERMHLDNVEILTDASQLEGKRATAKGFYNKRTGKITIVIPNNVSTIDAEQTLLHEAVAHYGLRQLFGKQFDTFLDNVYQSADESIRKKIAEMAAQNGWNFRTATEEYLAGLAEDTNFEDARGYASGWWQRVKRLFIDMLERIGFEGFRDKVGVVLTDNELRYILWRSYENLAEPGRYRSILGEAKDVAMQSDLKVGNYAERGIEAEYAAEPSAITELSKRFDEALKQYEERRLPQGFRFELGMPSAYLKSAGFPNLPICMRATVLARKAGDERHPFEASDLKGLVEAIQQPIAIFEHSKPNMRNLIVDVKRGDKHFLVGVTLDYKAGDIEIDSVSGLFPKESHEWIKWIQDGKAIRIDKKEKVQTIIDSLRTNPAESERIGLNLDDVTKIVKSFENPTVEEEELFRPGDFSPRDKALARHEYERIVSSGSYQFQEAVQDSMLGLKKLYQAILGPGKRIEDVVGFENAYLFENRMSSMNAGEQHEYFIRYMQPLLKEIGKICGADKRKRKELTDYLMAKHGLERNEYMRNEAAKNGEKTDRDFAGLIGLTGEADWQNAEDTARQWVDDYESMVDTAALWEAINKATKATLEKVYLSGIISKETYEKILGMYDYYVPLRGWNETTSEQVYGYLTSKDGPLGGSIMKKAEGRESMADDPIATIGMMADDAIRQGNRNLMKQRFLNFILNHPSDAVSVHDIWLEYNDAMDEWVPVFADIEDTDTADEVAQKVEAFEQRMEALRTAEPDRYKKGREAQHIPYKVVRNNLREHQILIKRGGRTFVATINGNPRAAQAINGLTNPDVDQNGVVGNMLKAGTWINRQLSAFYTTRNPDFVVSNFFRDALYSNCMTWVKESPRYALRFHKNFGRLNPVVMRRLLGKWENGTLDMSDKYEKMFYQFMKNGGETGYTNVRDIEGHKRAVAAELKKQGSTGRKAWAALGMQLDLLNRSAENCARFAAFVTSREFGRGIDRAIYDAKEISVNFNKKGSGGKMVNANGQTALGKIGAYLGGGGRLLYVFWNAGIQGMTNFARQAKLHPVKATAGASALMALGYAIPMLAEMLGGGDGDDDDKNAYYNLPEYIRRSNICFYAGEQWVTIPLPIEYRAMYGMGELAYGVISGNERYSGMEVGLQMAGQVTQLLPIDMLEGGGGISPFIPSAAKPFTEAYIMNKSWTGLPVYKDTAFNKDDPEWTKAYASADKHLVDFAKWLNETSGGDDYKKGYIDINPAKIEYLLNGTFGGMFTFPNKLNKTVETIFGDREFEWRNIPIANRLIKSGDERTANRKLQNEYFKYLKEYESTRKLMKKYENAADEGVIKYAEKVNFLENSPEYLRHEIFDSFKPDIDADREAIADAERSERATAENQMYADMRQLVNALHDPTAYFKNLYDAGLLDDEYIEWLKSHHGIKLK